MPRHRLICEVVLLATLVTSLTFAAGWIYPVWDDGRMMLKIQESGADAIWANFAHRPLVAAFYAFLFNHQLLLPVGIVLHWTAWLGMGLVTMHLWRIMFPAFSEFALLPGLLSVAPLLCKMQLVLTTIVTETLIEPVLTFLAVFMLLWEGSSSSRKLFFRALGLTIISFAILLSEYSVVTAIVGFILVGSKAIHGSSERKREGIIVAALIAGCVLLSYSLFLWLNRNSGFVPYRPSYILDVPSWRVRGIPFRWLSGIWRGAIGGFLESLGSVTLNSKLALLSFVCGLVVAGLTVLILRRRGTAEFGLKQDRFSAITLLVCLAVALIPVLLMDRRLESRFESRFWLGVLPVVSTLSVYILLYVLKSRLYILVPALCGFLAGYWTTLEIGSAVRDPKSLTGFAPHFDYQVADCINVEVGKNSEEQSESVPGNLHEFCENASRFDQTRIQILIPDCVSGDVRSNSPFGNIA